MKSILLLIAPKDFRDEEVFITKEELERRGCAVHISKRIEDLCSELSDFEFRLFTTPNELKQATSVQDNLLHVIMVDSSYLFTQVNFFHPFNYPGQIRYIVPLQKGEEGLIKRLLLSGANGLLHHEDAVDCYAQCIREVVQHGEFICPKVITALNPDMHNSNNHLSRLSVRQKIIVDLLLKGKSDKMIAESLNISFHTVKTHRKNIY